MKSYRTVLSIVIKAITIGSMLLVSQIAFSQTSSTGLISPGTPIPPVKQGVVMATQFPEPQVWINAMPVIGDPLPIPSVNVFMTLQNNTTQPINYTFPSSQTFDIFIKDRFGNVLSRWSRDMFFLQVITQLTIAPGESQTFGGSVSLTTIDNQFIDPGDYIISIQLTNINTGSTNPAPTAGLTIDPAVIAQVNSSPSSQMPLRIDWAF